MDSEVIIIEESLLDNIFDLLQKKEIKFSVLLSNTHQILDETYDEEDCIIEMGIAIEIQPNISYYQIFNLGRELEEQRTMNIQFQRKNGK
jgi:hypothetical protein